MVRMVILLLLLACQACGDVRDNPLRACGKTERGMC